MTHTVGIFGVNGNVGAPTAKLLAQAASEDKIKLVIFSRPGSTPKGLSQGKNVEFRELDLEGAVEPIEQAVKGVNFFITAIGGAGLVNEPKLVDALSKSPDIITYVPSTYSIPWTQKDRESKEFGHVVAYSKGGFYRAQEKGVGTTVLEIGAFHTYLFNGFVGISLNDNEVLANKEQLKHGFPISALDHIAHALTDLATRDPKSVQNKTFSAVSFRPTGNDLVALFTKLNGKPTLVKDYTKADRDEDLSRQMGPIKVGYFDRWEANDFGYTKNTIAAPSDLPSLEEYAERYLKQ